MAAWRPIVGVAVFGLRAPRSLVRPLAALAVAAVALESLISAATPSLRGREQQIEMLAPRAVPSSAHLLAILVSLSLLVLAAGLWRGTRRALTLTVVLLALVALLNLVKGLDYDESLLDLALMTGLGLGRRAFVLGCAPRPRVVMAIGAVIIWALAYTVALLSLLLSDRAQTISEAFRAVVGDGAGSVVGLGAWSALDWLLVVSAVLTSLWFLRSLLAPATSAEGHSRAEHARARALVASLGQDSLAPFILREDKSFHFQAGGVLAYRVVADTAVVSGDPVAPEGAAAQVLASFLELARHRGWHVVLSGASERHLAGYRELGLRHLHIGNEAFLNPAEFTLEGRAVRKVRQSVTRVQRRGWSVDALSAAEIEGPLAREIAELEHVWRSQRTRIVGFAMGMGACEPDQSPNDVLVLGRDPQGRLRALLRFVAHPGGLSLDAMRRVGDCPNGLNEALVVRAIEVARERGSREVSLNFAGFAHLMAAEAAELEGAHRRLVRWVLRLGGRRFQMERLVRFNEKFRPQWRGRFLVYDSRTRLPRLGWRVLQAEAYLPGPRGAPLQPRWRPEPTIRPELG